MFSNSMGRVLSACAVSGMFTGRRISSPALPRKGLFSIDITTTVYLVLDSLRSDTLCPSERASMSAGLRLLFG